MTTAYQRARATAKALDMTITRRPGGEFRVNYVGGGEGPAYYTNDLDDAVGTMKQMARQDAPAGKSPANDGKSLWHAAAPDDSKAVIFELVQLRISGDWIIQWLQGDKPDLVFNYYLSEGQAFITAIRALQKSWDCALVI